MTERRLTMLVHGEPGSGKSWLINSGPKPLLLLDAEGRAEYLADLQADPRGLVPQRVVYWNPRDNIPAESADPATVTVVDVQEFGDLERAYQWLASGKHPFRAVGIDSITEVQQRLIDKIAGADQMRLQDWGAALRELEKYVRALRDLRKHPTNPLWAVVVAAGTHDRNEMHRPMLQGQISLKIAHHFDVVGFLKKHTNPTTGAKERVMLIDGFVEDVQAKDNTHVLSVHYGDTIVNPNVSDMLRVLNPEPPQEQATETADEKERADA